MTHHRSIVDVLLVCGALASATWVAIDLRRPSGAELDERQGMLLRAFRADDVRRLVVERPGLPDLVVQRAPDGADTRFVVGGSNTEAAADEAMDAWLSALRLASPQRRVSSDASGVPAAALDRPSATLAIDLGSVSYRIVRGAPVIGNEKLVYVGVTGDGVASDTGIAVLATDTADRVFVTREALLTKQLLPAPPSEWRALEVGTATARLRLERAADGVGWRVGKPPVRVSRSAVRRIELALVRLEAQPRLALDIAQTALGRAGVELVVETGAESGPWRFELGGHCPNGAGIVALRHQPSPRAGCVPREILDAVAIADADVTDRGLFDATYDEIERLAVTVGETKLELARDESGFRLLSPTSHAVELERGNEYLKRLTAVRGTLAAPPAEAADTQWVGSVRIVISGAEQDAPREELIRLGATAPDGQREVLRVADGQRILLPRVEATLVSADATPLLPTEVFSLLPQDLRRLSLFEGSSRQVVTRDDKGRYALVEPRGFELDQEATERLVQTACGLKARRMVTPRDAATLGMGVPVLRLELHTATPGDSPRILEIGARGREGHVARSLPGDRLFLLAPETVGSLRSLILSKSVWNCGPSELLGMRLVLPHISFTVESDGTAFASSLAPSPQDDTLTSVVASLAPLGLVHFGAPLGHEGARTPVFRLERRPRPGAPAYCGKSIVFGTSDAWQEQAVHYAWIDGLDAVFAVPRSAVRALIGRTEGADSD